MKYLDGTDIRLGDIVELSDGATGIVVCSVDTLEYSQDYPEKEWSYLEKGVLVDFKKYGLIHYPDESVVVDFHKVLKEN